MGPSDPVTMSGLAELLRSNNLELANMIKPIQEAVTSNSAAISELRSTTTASNRRTEMMDRDARAASAIITNFPMSDFGLVHKATIKAKVSAARRFLHTAMNMPVKEVDSIQFRNVIVFPSKFNSGTATLRLDYSNIEDKERCYSVAKNLKLYNDARQGPKVRFDHDRTKEQQQARKERFDRMRTAGGGQPG